MTTNTNQNGKSTESGRRDNPKWTLGQGGARSFELWRRSLEANKSRIETHRAQSNVTDDDARASDGTLLSEVPHDEGGSHAGDIYAGGQTIPADVLDTFDDHGDQDTVSLKGSGLHRGGAAQHARHPDRGQ